MRMYDTRDAEMTVKVTGYQWMWKYEYLGEGVEFTSRLDRESDDIRQSGVDARTADHPHYLLDVDNQLVLPVDTKIRFVHHRRRRHPRLVGAGAGLEAGRHPGHHQRGLDRDRGAGHLPRPVRRAVRQGPRLHADRGRR